MKRLSIASTAGVGILFGGALLLGAGQAGYAAVDDLRRHVEYLASEELEGRLSGTAGERLATGYLVEQLEQSGAQPLPGLESFEMPFEFTAGTSDAGSRLVARSQGGEREWAGTEQIQALSFSDDGSVSGEVVFAGYGLSLPQSQDFGYDSYATLDVRDKIVLVLRYFPEEVDQETRGKLSRYSGLRYKALQARQRGAKGLLVVTGPSSPNAGETIPMSFDTAISGSGIVAASISGEVGEHLFSFVSGKSLASAQKELDDGNPHLSGFEIPGVEVTLDAEVKRERRTGYNVAGLLSGSAGGIDQPYVVLGAHYDHLGRGRGGNSLAKEEEAGGIHYGADDNASGVAAVLAAASRLAGMERRRGVVLAFWSGEELGVLGSSHFLKSEVLKPQKIAAYLNFDMVGRLRDNKLTVQAVGTSSVWLKLIEEANVPVGFDVQISDDPYLPTDSSSFNQASVPSLNFFTGSHEDYHRPSDTADRINYPDLERVAQFATLIAHKLANLNAAPAFIQVERKMQSGGDRDMVRAFTGTIPNYSTDVEGLLLSGVIGGGPAEEAGLREGDIIIEFAGQTIKNIYDYTYALDAVKIGLRVKVVFLRDGERHETTITPRARK